MFVMEKNLYRIGDFAKKLGVTPDMLKYCEKKGIISSVKTENGYRYYDFRQSSQIIEYMKLQNQGFSADEIYSTLHADSLEDLIALEHEHHRELEKKVLFYQALIERNRQTEQFRGMFSDEPKWMLRKRNPAWFIKHTKGETISDDPNIQRLVREWNVYLPIVESACCYGWFDTLNPEWGLYIDSKYAEQFDLDTSEPVRYVPESLVLAVYITRPLKDHRKYVINIGKTLPQRLGLRQNDEAYHRVIAKMWTNEYRREYSILNIPVEYE